MNRSPSRPLAIFVSGPTASGKTDLALALRQRLPCEIISVDSAMIYRGMDIGTAKPDAATLATAPHRLIDIRDPSERYSAATFRDDALAAMREISAAGAIPLLVGGTGLYFRTLEQGISPLPAADPTLRAALAAAGEQQGWPALHRQLAAVDPVAAARINPHDPQRLQRALEVYQLTGRPISDHWAEQKRQTLPWQPVKIALVPADRQRLHQRIADRFEAMLAAGFLDEVAALMARSDLQPELPALRAVGYRQAWQHLSGAIDAATMQQRAIAATRQYAKRQITWLRREEGYHWIEPATAKTVATALKWITSSTTHRICTPALP